MTTHGRTSPGGSSSARTRFLCLTGALVVGMAVAVPALPAAASDVAKVELGTLEQFGVLAGSTVTNTGATTLNGLDLGVTPGTAVTGFPPGILLPPGVQHVADGVAAQAQKDATTAFNQAAGLPADNPTAYTQLGGKTLLPGVYQGNLSLTGTVTLDNGDDPDAVFVFQASSTLITASSSVVTFTNADHPSCNVFWQVSSSATLGTDSTFVGTLDALTTVTAGTGATIQGRLIARTAAVNLDNNTITRAPCAAAPPVTTPPVTTPPVTTPPVTTPPVTTPPVTTPPVTTPPVTTPPVTTPPTTTPTVTSPPITTPTTTTPPPQATTSPSTLSVSTSPTTTPPQDTTSPTTLPVTTSTADSTTDQWTEISSSLSGTEITDTTGSYYTDTATDTYTYTYTDTTASSTDTGYYSGGGGDSGNGELASTGSSLSGPQMQNMLLAGFLAVLGGGVLLMLANRRRTQPGSHRSALQQ